MKSILAPILVGTFNRCILEGHPELFKDRSGYTHLWSWRSKQLHL